MTSIFPYVGNVIIPIDELIFLEWDETTNQSCFGAPKKAADILP